MFPSVGLVLAGGGSRRMGRDKATLVVAGRGLAAWAAERLAAVCREVVVADGGRGVVPGRRSVADGAGRGPIAGLLGAAAVLPGAPLLALACDLPAVSVALLAELVRLARSGPTGGLDWVVPRGPRLEPLVALYSPAALAALAARAARGDFALHGLAAEPALAIGYLEGAELARFGDPAVLFANLNTPADLAAFPPEGRGEPG